MIDINLTGVWHTCKAAIPHHLRRRLDRAHELDRGPGRHSPTSATTWRPSTASSGLMKSLAGELAPRMIRVNSVHPTTVDTPMVINEATFRLFAAEERAPDAARPFKAMSTLNNVLPIPWVEERSTSPTRCSSWPPTRRATSPASRCRSTPACCRGDDGGGRRRIARPRDPLQEPAQQQIEVRQHLEDRPVGLDVGVDEQVDLAPSLRTAVGAQTVGIATSRPSPSCRLPLRSTYSIGNGSAAEPGDGIGGSPPCGVPRLGRRHDRSGPASLSGSEYGGVMMSPHWPRSGTSGVWIPRQVQVWLTPVMTGDWAADRVRHIRGRAVLARDVDRRRPVVVGRDRDLRTRVMVGLAGNEP